uniref:Uncharacterized protein n=1 Tax=Oryza sativa subsp. japonica TaxID=39947 RepID=Q2QRZ0_ORYSJ|nr:hypothetical protein LOC_Os12g25920 [Oryza sativa Japonica Group]
MPKSLKERDRPHLKIWAADILGLDLNWHEDEMTTMKMISPIKADEDVCSGEHTSRRRRRQTSVEDVDAQQQRDNRPAVQAETLVGDGEGKLVGEDVNTQQQRHNRPAVQAETPVGGDEGKPVGEDVDAQQQRHNRPAVQAETPVGDDEGKPAMKT